MATLGGPAKMKFRMEDLTHDEEKRMAAVIRWWERHRKLRRGTNRRSKSHAMAVKRFGAKLIDGFEHGVQYALVLVKMGDDFNIGYWAGQEWRWAQKREKQRRPSIW